MVFREHDLKMIQAWHTCEDREHLIPEACEARVSRNCIMSGRWHSPYAFDGSDCLKSFGKKEVWEYSEEIGVVEDEGRGSI